MASNRITTTGPTAPKERTVALDCVHSLEETRNIRSRGVSSEHVARMAPFVADLPPIDVVALTDGRYGILAGYHRWSAYREAERKTIKVLVHDLPVDEWLRFGVHSNIAHGLPLTLFERKAAAKRMLDDGDRRSDRAIADDCGLDHKTIGKLRQLALETESTGEDPQLRVGLDGKTRRVANTGRRLAETREAVRLVGEASLADEEIAEQTGVSLQRVAGFRAMSSRPLRSIETFKRLGGVPTEEKSLSERWHAWAREANLFMTHGARLARETEKTEGAQLDGHAQLALMIYQRMTERELDAEIRRFYEQEGS